MNARWHHLTVLGALVLAMALTACGGAAASVDLEITATDITWDRNELTAVAGQTVHLTIHNDGALAHNFTLADAGVNMDVAPGSSQTVSFTAPAAGTYPFLCDEPGHEKAGMVGTFVSQ